MALISSASYQFFYISFLGKMVIQLSSYKLFAGGNGQASNYHGAGLIAGSKPACTVHCLFLERERERERERGHLAFKDADNPNAGSICHGTN